MHPGPVAGIDAAARQHHQVYVPKLMLHETKAFPCRPLDAVAAHRVAGRLDRDRQAKSGTAEVVAAREHGEHCVARTGGALKYCLKFCGMPEAAAARKPEPALAARRPRYGQSRARPLRRRRFRIARPLLLAMRARKPCVRLRRKLLGW